MTASSDKHYRCSSCGEMFNLVNYHLNLGLCHGCTTPKELARSASVRSGEDFGYEKALCSHDVAPPSSAVPIHPLVAAARWILNDAAYKPPEEIGDIPRRWLDRLQEAMAQEGKPISDVSATVPHAGWISVNDRLPERSLPAVMALHREGPWHTYWLAYYFGERKEWQCALKAYPKKLDVTHWMPLPEYPADVQAACDAHIAGMRNSGPIDRSVKS